jgi:hypothetical protein
VTQRDGSLRPFTLQQVGTGARGLYIVFSTSKRHFPRDITIFTPLTLLVHFACHLW